MVRVSSPRLPARAEGAEASRDAWERADGLGEAARQWLGCLLTDSPTLLEKELATKMERGSSIPSGGVVIDVMRTGEGDPLEFEVIVHEGKRETRHRATIDKKTCGRLTASMYLAEDYLEATFRFLLDREPKESILSRFDVRVISRYFPEFERELPRYFSRS
jgi:hypothetical protein